MSVDRVDAILDAAHACLIRHGVRRTTMEDIAQAAGVSRPAAYQYVRGKEDAFRRLAVRLFDAALVAARTEASADATLAQRLDRTLAVRFALITRLRTEGHAAELLDVCAEQERLFLAAMGDLLTATIIDAAGAADLALGEEHAREFAELTLILVRGLEAERSPELARERLRNGTALLVAGLAASVRPASYPRVEVAAMPG